MNMMKKLVCGVVCAAVALGAARGWAGSTSPYGEGGEVTFVGDNKDAVHTFTATGDNTFELFSEQEVWFLVVGGGGAGGNDCAGGGGAGGFVESNSVVLAAGTYTVTVGAGGQPTSGNGGSGGDSAISNGGVEIVCAKGGGGGGAWAVCSGSSGGSGGGATKNGGNPGAGVPGQGNAGGYSTTYNRPNGGGGAGAAGGIATGNKNAGKSGDGGDGLASSISGVSTYYAGGGGGGGYNNNPGNGGLGGGGNGADTLAVASRQAATLPDGRNQYDAEAGVDGLGGGGGGGNNDDHAGRPGGSGVVVIRIAGDPNSQLEVSSDPEGIGSPSPAYGGVAGLSAGDTVAVSCGAVSVTNEEQTIFYTCTGWKLYDDGDNIISSGSDTAFTYTHPSPAAYRRLEWQWSRSVAGTIASAGFGSVLPSGTAWYSCDTPVTVTATPDSGLGFAYWTGTLPAGIDSTAASVTFTPEDPFEMTAFFGAAHYTKTLVTGGDILYTFFASGPITFSQTVNARLLLVGGGGAGGSDCGGGGGAGGMIDTNNVELAAGTYTVTVGAGGRAVGGSGQNGGDSSIVFGEEALFTAIGGGGGAGYSAKNGKSGGSGGGSVNKGTGGAGTPGQGYAGGNATVTDALTGGGGAGGPAVDSDTVDKNTGGRAGGPGKISDITGEEIYYAGGGGGGGWNYTTTLLNGGIGGGGNGALNLTVATRQALTLPDGRNLYEAECGVDGLGGGGGGGANNVDMMGRPGGRGTVIIRESFNRLAVSLDVDEVVYDPVSQTLPTVTVTDALDGTPLVQGTDYDVAFSNTTAVGTATVYITGRGGYGGYAAKSQFSIYPVFHVTAYSLAEEGDGLSWASPMSLPHAIATASAGDTIFLKAGTYTPTANIAISKPLVILGGFAGTDNTTLDPDSPMSVFDANMNTAVTAIFNVTTATGVDTVNVFERIEVKNGYERGFIKTGNASLVFRNCAFTSCGTTRASNYNGRGGSFTGTAQSTLSFENCTFARNAFAASAYMLNLGSGFGAYFSTWKSVLIDDSLFVSNGLSSAMVNGGYNGSGRDGNAGAAFYATAAPMTIRNSDFRANIAGVSGSQRGGIAYLAGNCNGSIIQNCIFAGNACEWCHNNGFTSSDRCGVVVFAADNSARTLDVENCTFAYNLIDGTYGTAGIDASKGALTVRNTIFYGAKGGQSRACGKDIHVYADATADIDYCLFEEDSDDCFTTALPNILVMGEHNVFGDPLFATPLSAITPYLITSGAYTGYSLAAFDEILSSIDVHVSNTAAAFSRAIDTGDPSSPYANEPAPNGGVVNLGAYGNTAEAATSTFQGLPTLAAGDISISFADDTRPTVSATIGGSTPYNALFKIEISGEDLSQGGAVVESVAAGGVQTGESLTLAGLGYYTPGEPLYVRITVTAPGQSAIVVNTSATVTGTLPPYVGHGGGANVIHVREGADGLQDGSNWANAFASFTEAQRALAGNADKTEMWIAGTIVETVAPASVTIAAPLTIRGGFTGVEDSADERVPGAVSTLDGNGTRDLLKLANAAANPIKVERLIFARAYKRALENTGVGALTVTDCQFVNSRAVGPSGTNDDYGRGAYLNGKFVAAFTNCVFRGNVKVNLGSSHAQGSAIYAEGLTRVFIDNCLFVTNGVISTSGLGESTAGRDQANGDCIWMNGSPITATRCHFRGNRGAVRNVNTTSSTGGIILLSGKSGNSAFTNCTFTGNWGGWATHKSSMTTTYVAGGTVDIRLNSATDKVDFENCTIAYNLGDTYCIPGGLHVEVGDVNMHNCIIFGNRHGQMTLDGIGHDIYVRGSSKLHLSHCRLAAADAETPGKPDANYVSAASTATLTYDNLTFGDPLFLTPLADFESELKVVDSGSYEGFSFLGTSYNVSGNVISTSNANANFDVHLRSKYGMYNNAGEFIKARGYLSDAIDAGDRNSPYQNEPQPNGRRVNLGAYGNTPWATRSAGSGIMIVVR